jgi:hypothetical protein
LVKRLLLVALAACQPPGTDSRHGIAADQIALLDLVGSYRWLHRGADNGTIRIEDEAWSLRADSAARLTGRYLRSIEVRSTTGAQFQCSQQPWYLQRALIDVVFEVDGDGVLAHETAVQTEPSPCDHPFRRLTTYTVTPRGTRVELGWDGGSQTLWHVDGRTRELPTAPWSAEPQLAGAWRWQTRSLDDERNIREEAEWWEITRRSETQLDATYRRRVEVHSVSGAPIACAGAPSWSFDDTYILDGEREEEHWHFRERAVSAGSHPCLARTERTTDEATAEQLGDFLVLEWRGKRRQVLARTD